MLFYSLALHKIFGIANTRLLKITNRFDSEKQAYEKIIQDPERYLSLPERDRLDEKASLKEMEIIAEFCKRERIEILPLTHPDYPVALKNIASPPGVIFVKGDYKIFKEHLTICIVGTREASRYGVEVADYLSFELARRGVVIVSGLAYGVDAASHRGAICAKGGLSVGVMACGMSVDYPKGHDLLKAGIVASGGCVITELFPKDEAKGTYFHARNRILAGLSQGTVVVEAPMRSGSIITANHAAEMGRDVFCIPPQDILDEQHFGGVNSFLRDGAYPVFDFTDILEQYKFTHDGKFNDLEESSHHSPIIKTKKSVSKKRQPKQLKVKKGVGKEEVKKPVGPEVFSRKKLPSDIISDDGKLKIVKVISDKRVSIDGICEETGIDIVDVTLALSEMEIFGVVTRFDGGDWQLTDDYDVGYVGVM